MPLSHSPTRSLASNGQSEVFMSSFKQEIIGGRVMHCFFETHKQLMRCCEMVFLLIDVSNFNVANSIILL